MVLPRWIADTRRVLNDRPSRTRSTVYTIGTCGSPGLMKYACRECTGRSAGTVRPAATSAWPATWPPNTRCIRSLGPHRGIRRFAAFAFQDPRRAPKGHSERPDEGQAAALDTAAEESRVRYSRAPLAARTAVGK